MRDWAAVPRIREQRQLGGRVAWFNGWGASSIAVDPRGRCFLTAGARGLRLFEAASGELVRTFEGRGNGGTTWERIAFSADGRFAWAHVGGVISEKSAIGCWEVETGARIRLLEPGGTISAIDREGRRALARGQNANPILWDLDEGVVLRTLTPRPFGGLEAAAFVSGSEAVAGDGRDGVLLWNVDTSAVVWHRNLGTSFTLAAPSDGSWFAAGGQNGLVRIHDTRTGDLRHSLQCPGRASVLSLAVSPEGAHLAACAGPALLVWNVERREQILERKRDEGSAVAFSPDGAWIAVTGPSGVLERIDLAPGIERPAQDATLRHRAPIANLAFDVPGTLYSSDESGTVLAWDANGDARRGSDDQVPRPRIAEGAVLAGRRVPPWLPRLDAVANRWTSAHDLSSPFGTIAGEDLAVAMVLADEVIVFDLDESPTSPLQELFVGQAPGANVSSLVRALALHPDGRRVAIGSTRVDAPLQLWDAREGRPLAILDGHEGPVGALAFNADGTLLASGSDDRTVRLWKI